jgi:SOS-response transcriptional repressor LexA
MEESFIRDITGCASGELYALRVIGDSMTPEFQDGSIIVIDPTGVLKDGSYVIAVHNDEYIFRQYRKRDDRHFLVTLQEGHEEIELESHNAVKGIIIQQQPGRRRKDRKFYT